MTSGDVTMANNQFLNDFTIRTPMRATGICEHIEGSRTTIDEYVFRLNKKREINKRLKLAFDICFIHLFILFYFCGFIAACGVPICIDNALIFV